jgi:beta propeller repeat protein
MMKKITLLTLCLLIVSIFFIGCVDEDYIPEELEGLEYEEDNTAIAGKAVIEGYRIGFSREYTQYQKCRSTDTSLLNPFESGKSECYYKGVWKLFIERCYGDNLLEFHQSKSNNLIYSSVKCSNKCKEGACVPIEPIRPTYEVALDISGLNQKDHSKYSENEVFIISDENWKDVLTLVSMTTWTEENIVNKYPALVYHKEGENIDVDSLIHFLQQYQPNKVTIIGNVPQQLGDLLIAEPDFGVGVDNSQINLIGIDEYLSYWDNLEAVIYVEDNYESSLLASTYASLFNAPLIIEGTVFDSDNILEGKIIVCVGEVDRECTVSYDLDQIAEKYLAKTNTNKVILVNPNDINQLVSSPVLVEKTVGEISDAYGKTSLLAPFLASAKQQLLLSYPLGNYENDMDQVISKFNEIRTFLQGKLSSLNLEPEYLTIMASHIAIPESYYDGVYRRFLLDWKYVTDEDPITVEYSDQTPSSEINVGRILGITPTDVSSYVARSVFYDDTYDNIYPNDDKTITAIGHSFTVFERDAEYTLEKAEMLGYGGECFAYSSEDNCEYYFRTEQEDYQNKQIIFFQDHGNPDSWAHNLDYDEIPPLDLPYVNTLTCLANTVWEGESNTFGPNMLRKGAISYSGGLGLVPALGGVCANDNSRTCHEDYGNCDSVYCCLPNTYIYDLETNEIEQITNDYANAQYMAKTNGETVIWVDGRMSNEHAYMPRLYSYDLESGTEQQISFINSKLPSLYNDKVVFQGRHYYGGYHGYGIVFCELNPESEYYCNDGNFKQISSHLPSERGYPSIYENIVVWDDQRNDEGDVYMCDLTPQSEYECGVNEKRLTFEGKQYFPKVYGNNIVWRNKVDTVQNIQKYDILSEEVSNYNIANNPYFLLIYEDLVVYNVLMGTKLYLCSLDQDSSIVCGSGSEKLIDEGFGLGGVVNEDIFFYTKSKELFSCSLVEGSEYECGINPKLIDSEYQKISSSMDISGNKLIFYGIKDCTDRCISNGFPGSKSLTYLKDDPDQSLGELQTKLLTDDWINGEYDSYSAYHYNRYNLFLGDPTLEPRWT